MSILLPGEYKENEITSSGVFVRCLIVAVISFVLGYLFGNQECQCAVSDDNQEGYWEKKTEEWIKIEERSMKAHEDLVRVMRDMRADFRRTK